MTPASWFLLPLCAVIILIVGFVGGVLFSEHEIEPDPRQKRMTRAEMTIPYVAVQEGYDENGKPKFYLVPQHAAGRYLEEGTVKMDNPPYIDPPTERSLDDDEQGTAAGGTDPL